jgi:hypothetical protein
LELAALRETKADTAASQRVLAARFETLAAEIEEGGKGAQAQQKFLGLNWGLGLGASYYFDDAIEDAAVVDGVVRVTKDRRAEPRVLLEFHRFFFTSDADGKEPGQNGKAIESGHGPFVAVAAKDNDVLAGVAAGWMFGWKDTQKSDDSNAFTVGLGVILDSDVTDLADGFKEGQPLPAGETSVRFEEKSRAAAVLIFTRTF